MKLHPVLGEETDLLKRMWNEVNRVLLSLLSSLFFFPTWCFWNGRCFRTLLYGNNKTFELNFVSKYQDSTKFFMLNLLLAISWGPQTHGMASDLTFRKVTSFLYHINKAFYCLFQKKEVFIIFKVFQMVFRKWKLVNKMLLVVYK